MDLFDEFDVDHSGDISFDEFAAAMESLGENREAKINEWFAQLDFDGDGRDDLAVYNGAGDSLVASAGENRPETVSVQYDVTDGPIYVQVDGFEDAQGTYTLAWEIAQ